MKQSENSYNQLIQNLDGFIRRFYLNQLVKGFLYLLGLTLSLFILITTLEYFLYFNTIIRKLLFWGYLAVSGAVLFYWIINPLLKYYRLGKVISRNQAAIVVGQHFQDVKDKMLNILQLKESSYSQAQNDLLIASIEQKATEIKHINFVSAINIQKNNKKYLKYALLPILIILLIFITIPDVIKISTGRIVQNDKSFAKEAPFQFYLISDKPAIQHEDYLIEVETKGNLLPNQLDLVIGRQTHTLNRSANNTFTHKINNVQEEVDFYFKAGEYRSASYHLEVLKKPTILSFEIALKYPAYTKKNNEKINSGGDLYVPAGTQAIWTFKGKAIKDILIAFNNSSPLVLNKKDAQTFYFEKQLLEAETYTVSTNGIEVDKGDSITYNIQVVPDLYPTIQVVPTLDSNDMNYLYFIGEAADDYGIKRLVYKYQVIPDGETQAINNYNTLPITYQGSQTLVSFSHYQNLSALNLQPGDKVNYYFEVWDNDGVHGSKSTRSSLMTFKLPNKNELEKKTNENNEQLKTDVSNSVEQAQDLQEEVRQIQEQLLQKKKLDWQDKKKIEQVLEKQKNLQNTVESIKENFNQNLSQQKKFKQLDEDILKKYESLQKLLEETVTDEMKELMKQLSELLEKMENEQAIENLEEFEESNEELEENLDQMLALFQKLEFEQKLQETIDELDQLAKEQEQLSEETLDPNNNSEDLKQKQEKLNEQFEDTKEKLADLQEMQKNMEEKSGKKSDEQIEDVQPQANDISKQMQNSKESLENNQSKKASEQQKNSSEKLGDLSEQLSTMQASMKSSEVELNLRATRQILENLIQLSFDQEDIIERTKTVKNKDPQYVQLIQDQYKLKDETKIVKDSLQALAKRVFQIESFITKEVNKLTQEVDQSIDYMEARNTRQASVRQQLAMTSMNNLALMLSEIMEQMQQQMASQMKGDQMCQNPGGKKSGKQGKNGQLPDIGDMQKSLNQQLESLKKMMKEGKQPGGQGLSREFAKMAQQQAQIRQALEQFNKEQNKDGAKSYGDIDKMLKNMDKTEEDLVNKRLTEELLSRQEDIMTRLLEAETAERERELDNKRTSNTAEEIDKKIPPQLEEYLKKRQAETDLLKTLPPNLKPYYRNLVEGYFKEISF